MLIDLLVVITIYNSEYWSENLSKWIELAGLNTRASWSWRDFGGSDVEGAVAGGVAGGLGGALAGGAGALPGAAIGAATVGVGASAGYAARKLWNYLWD